MPNGLLQFGHFRDRDVIRSSTQSLQKTWPQVLRAVSLNLILQTVQMARVWRLEISYLDGSYRIREELTRSISYSSL